PAERAVARGYLSLLLRCRADNLGGMGCLLPRRSGPTCGVVRGCWSPGDSASVVALQSPCCPDPHLRHSCVRDTGLESRVRFERSASTGNRSEADHRHRRGISRYCARRIYFRQQKVVAPRKSEESLASHCHHRDGGAAASPLELCLGVEVDLLRPWSGGELLLCKAVCAIRA